MAEKVTSMQLKVDLQCPSCYKKIKKILCKYPQIRDQEYDEKHNLVKIKVVVCCSPEKIRDDLLYKGGKVIKGIEIVKPPESKEPGKPQKPKGSEVPKQPDKPKAGDVENPKEPGKAKEKPKDPAPEKPAEKPKEPAKADPPKKTEAKPAPVSAAAAPLIFPPATVPLLAEAYPIPVGYYSAPPPGYVGGGPPYYYEYGVPVPLRPSYHDNYGYGYSYASRGDYFSEENASACVIM